MASKPATNDRPNDKLALQPGEFPEKPSRGKGNKKAFGSVSVARAVLLVAEPSCLEDEKVWQGDRVPRDVCSGRRTPEKLPVAVDLRLSLPAWQTGTLQEVGWLKRQPGSSARHAIVAKHVEPRQTRSTQDESV